MTTNERIAAYRNHAAFSNNADTIFDLSDDEFAQTFYDLQRVLALSLAQCFYHANDTTTFSDSALDDYDAVSRLMTELHHVISVDNPQPMIDSVLDFLDATTDNLDDLAFLYHGANMIEIDLIQSAKIFKHMNIDALKPDWA